jgi:hypothetical protein
MAELADVHGSGDSKRAKMGKKVRWMRGNLVNQNVAVVVPESHWSVADVEVQERVRRLGGSGGGWRRSTSSNFIAGVGEESANLTSIQGVLGRFLGRGGRGERGTAPGGHGSARGGQNRRGHGEVDAVVFHMCSSCTFPFSVCLNEEKGRWRRG